MPMNVDDEEELLGLDSDDVPKQDPTDEDCMGKKTSGGTFKGYCRATPGRGTDHVGKGRCKHHGGLNSGENGQGADEQNTNAATHGAYVEENAYYQQILGDEGRDLVDAIFEDYVEQYQELHGEPTLGHETELFRIAVSHVKDIELDRWTYERPEDLDSGNGLVARETHYTDNGKEYHKYKESTVLSAQKKLSSDRRMWLKDLGLLEDPESQKADALAGLKDEWKHSASQ